jgi:hypothetical protein
MSNHLPQTRYPEREKIACRIEIGSLAQNLVGPKEKLDMRKENPRLYKLLSATSSVENCALLMLRVRVRQDWWQRTHAEE